MSEARIVQAARRLVAAWDEYENPIPGAHAADEIDYAEDLLRQAVKEES